MKIGIDLTSLNDNFSGIERYSYKITEYMIKQNKEDNFVLFFKNEIFNQLLEYTHYSNVVSIILKGNFLLINQLKLPYAIKKLALDVMLYPAFPPALLFNPKKVRKYSVIHDMVCFDKPETMKYKAKIYFQKAIHRAVKISDGIITVSNFSKTRLEAYFPEQNLNILIAHNATDIKYSTQANIKQVLDKYQIPNDYVLSLSTLEPRKNLKHLVEWMIKIWSAYPSYPDLVLVGRKGWKMNDMLQSIPENFIARIHVTGFVDDSDLPVVYKQSKFFIFPSLYEGFGIPIIEAIHMDKLVLASDIEPSVEILQNKDFIFRLDEVEDFIKKFKKLYLLDDVTYQYSLKSYQKTISRFSWSKSASQIRDFFEI